MSRIRYYTDEHVATAVVRGLRRRGLDVLTVTEADMRGASDRAHLELALRDGRVIFTQDADFLRLHAAGVTHAGIVYVRQGRRIGDVIRGLLLLHELLAAEDLHGHVEFI